MFDFNPDIYTDDMTAEMDRREILLSYGGEFTDGLGFGAYGEDEAERMYIEERRDQYYMEFFTYLSESGDERYLVDW